MSNSYYLAVEDVPFLRLMAEELLSAEIAHRPFVDYPHGWVATYEELMEVWDEVRKKPGERCPKKILKEAVQCATMCWRMCLDNGAVPRTAPQTDTTDTDVGLVGACGNTEMCMLTSGKPTTAQCATGSLSRPGLITRALSGLSGLLSRRKNARSY